MWLFVLPSLVMAVLVISISWTYSRGAPWAPTPISTVRRMLTLAEVGPGDVVYDLGCGDGRMIVTAAQHYGARAVGIEIDPLRYLLCQIRITALGLRGRVRVLFGNFFAQDLRGADVVTCYLLQSTNAKLEEKLVRELSPGARVVSNTFTFAGLRLLCQDDHAKVYVYGLDDQRDE